MRIGICAEHREGNNTAFKHSVFAQCRSGAKWFRKFLAPAFTLIFAFCAFIPPISAENENSDSFVSNPADSEMVELSQSLKLDESLFGCGPLLEPGRTFYVTLSGNDEADGLTIKTAWRTVGKSVNRLAPGDTLVITEGEYSEPNFQIKVSGEPKRPITIMGAPRQRVILTTSFRVPTLNATAGTRYTFETDIAGKPAAAPWAHAVTHRQASATGGNSDGVWEADTLIELQDEIMVSRVEEIPGSYCYDAKSGKLYVHYSDSRTSAAHGGVILSGPGGTEIMGSYLCIRNLKFMFCENGLGIGGDARQMTTVQPGENEYRYNFRGGHHVTVEDCAFAMNTGEGLQLTAGARWTLVKNNYGVRRGTIQMRGSDMSDNLFINNRLDSSSPTMRTDGRSPRGISNYGWPGEHVRRYYVINNIINHSSSFLSKAVAKKIVFEGNILHNLNFQGPPDGNRERSDRLVVRNNVILSKPALLTEGPGGYGANWAGPITASLNNFLVDERASGKSLAEARFADPAYFDFRLQSDSPLIGKALGGGDAGAFRTPKGRVFFVGPGGKDDAQGTSMSSAWRTLATAASRLKPGDTLYLLPGKYREELELSVSGTAAEPIVVRAHGKRTQMPPISNRAELALRADGHEPAVLPGVTIKGSHVVVEGISVAGGQSDGFKVHGSTVTLKHCISRNNTGAGVMVTGADVELGYCTLTDNQRGLVLTAGSQNAVMRDSLIAGNRRTAVEDETNAGWLGSDNLYFGSGAKEATANELRSIVADPLFVNPSEGNYRLRWDSPGAYLGLYAQPSGAIERMAKVPEIEDVKVVALGPEFAVVTWMTPRDDTYGKVEYRVAGSGSWAVVETGRQEQGTIHSAGLERLKKGTQYQYRISVNSRRGGEAVGQIMEFRTTTMFSGPATYYVAPDGNDAADGRSQATAWRTIRKANYNVKPGDTVLVSPGRYTHAIAPRLSGQSDRRITYRRNGDGETFIDGGRYQAPLVFLRGKSHVTVDGFIFTGMPSEHEGTIRVIDSDEVRILNCRVGYGRERDTFFSIRAMNCRNLLIEGNVLHGAASQLHVAGTPGLVVRNNTFAMPQPNRGAGGVNCVQVFYQTETARFTNNIFYGVGPRATPQVAVYPGEYKGELLFDYNLFFSGGKKKIIEVYGEHGKLLTPGATLQEWQANSGQDAHSIHADPLFVDVKEGDFRLQAGSPAVGAGEKGVTIGALETVK